MVTLRLLKIPVTTLCAKQTGEAGTADKAVGPDSVGHKLLKMMGWSGGGLGKGGSGISEPITAESVINREGFGTKSAAAEFKAKVTNFNY